MGRAAKPPLTIWAVSDGRAGIEAQAVGLAHAVARLRSAEVIVKRIGWRWGLGRLPSRLNPALPWTIEADSPIAPPWPDLWIAAGRATLPLSVRMRARSGGRTFVVQTQDPRVPLDPFDLVIPPAHDQLVGPNVFPILGAPNRLTPERLAEELARWQDRLAALPHPRVAVIVGGRSKVFDLPEAHAAALATRIAGAVERAGGSLLLSFTRRTPEAARRAMRERLARLPGIIWDDQGENPYFAFLAAADAILITEDSTNLATDAAATGKPVHVLPMVGRGSDKFRKFHEDLARRGVARPFDDGFPAWRYAPLAETDRAAKELLRRFDARE
ncbi:mitochondrial fission ELM1 family protein [Phenylobacterium sp.]|uniref:mitochondrial fission ELM1 family protein n=1 Tax=Phenylobacterium sp. TaxID=1871053 RepID=UPI002D096CCA|nr:mitochondrial fission ELM1 family protein [Phenylobacterium sp.]HVI33656.1 mitochondrial fission ELM1 family protein [Phenylobacterium sp.]